MTSTGTIVPSRMCFSIISPYWDPSLFLSSLKRSPAERWTNPKVWIFTSKLIHNFTSNLSSNYYQLFFNIIFLHLPRRFWSTVSLSLPQVLQERTLRWVAPCLQSTLYQSFQGSRLISQNIWNQGV